MENKYYVLLSVLLVAALLFGCTSKTSQERTTTTTPTIAKIGENVITDKITWKVERIDTTSVLGSSYLFKETKGLFLIISLTVENTGKDTDYISTSYVTLTDSKERTYEPDAGLAIYANAYGDAFLFEKLSPNVPSDGIMVFEIPKDATGLKLKVKGSSFGSEKTIDLGR